jgi:hypothetical protein
VVRVDVLMGFVQGKHGSERIQRLITATNALQSRVDYVIHEEGATCVILLLPRVI